ncbi:hypothetical protein SODALDRAFT_333688 [Sodiomyces alkalinus F11]|uniref:Protein SQS1 n=1 Tax=Sodiomyces alkalinus (strain CBS 110278 / VKM F-3762 / F11) TaxID=1314773 RepID=A0A3N2PTU3_SODAK|nr:hypothetical protein SODALDRAFT_333688 [Sodiomyces alkalinus F11]ROT37923.1 hypothetical protein SODALDRAFT_333688 [Sodiomyces alkalinus F11]
MPRSSTKRGGYRASPRNGKFRISTKSDCPASNQQELRGSSTAFTLADEARSTAHGQDAWSRESRLRSRPVCFVSAGAVDPTGQLEQQLQQKASNALEELSQRSNEHEDEPASNMTPKSGPATATLETELTKSSYSFESISRSDQGQLETSVSRSASNIPAAPSGLDLMSGYLEPKSIVASEADVPGSSKTNSDPASLSLFFVDTTRDSSYRDRIPVQGTTSYASDDPDADSSEEVILFKGRNHPRKPKSPVAQAFDLAKLRSEIHVVSEAACTSAIKRTLEDDSPKTFHNHEPASKNISKEKRRKARKKCITRPRSVVKKEDEVLADYIANMRQYESEDKADLSDLDGLIRTLDSTQKESPIEDHCLAGGTGAEQRVEMSSGISLGNFDAEMRTTDATRSHDTEPADKDSPPSIHSPSDDDIAEEEDFVAMCSLNRMGIGPVDTDYMSWDVTPESRRKQKKSKLPQFGISDSELEGQMQTAFNRNRLKKAERKRERQELRALGLLGRKTEPQDLRAKYPHRMALDQIADELRSFLLGAQSSSTLPPMDNHARKVIHELANKFYIKSKSTGAGNQRRPTLTRTVRTFKYSEDVFDVAISQVARKYYPTRDIAGSTALQKSSGRRGAGHSATSYRDGEVVGGSAPELGQENRGRAMLERMGWSNGTALGTMTNKGILQPVAHVVKLGKAGLG